MIPDGVLSTFPVSSGFDEPVSRRTIPLVDYEMGGVAIGDANQGLMVKLWTLESNGEVVRIFADDVPAVDLFTRTGITQVALAFDQSMRPHVAFVQDGVTWLWWYDSAVGAMVFSAFVGASTPRLTLDEKRTPLLANSDVIFAYIRANNLYYRQQRDRFQNEYLLASSVNAQLVAIGMNRGYRLQFRLRPNA